MKSKKLSKIIQAKVIEWYNINAEEFSQSRDLPQTKELEILFQQLPKQSYKILDYGCGNGNTITYLDQLNLDYHYTGYDPAEILLKEAQNRYQNKENILFTSVLPVNEKYDLVLSRAVLHHLTTDYEVVDTLEKLLQLVKDDGYLFFTTWNISKERILKKGASLETIEKLEQVATDYQIDSSILIKTLDSSDIFLPWGKKGWRYYRQVEKHIDKYLRNISPISKGTTQYLGGEGNNYYLLQKRSYIQSSQQHFSNTPITEEAIKTILLKWIQSEQKVFNYFTFLKYFRKEFKEKAKTIQTPKKSFFLNLIKSNQTFFGEEYEKLYLIFRSKPIRSLSGVSNIMIMTKPLGCPFKCTYCPNDKDLPKSYIKNEPAVFRGVRHQWDAIEQISNRIKHLEAIGHYPSKIELIIAGGTWSAHPLNYQQEYIRKCYEALNNSAFSMKTLTELQQENEQTQRRLIGLTLETRPDYITEEELWRMREYGCTRIEIGVQTTSEQVHLLTKRGHTSKEVITATELMKDFGFKITYHMMPNLPGATIESDIEDYKNLFTNEVYQPDQLKIYPCMVIENTELYNDWKKGKYYSYTEEELKYLLKEAIQHIPPYVRISRLIRDIPSTEIASGMITNNLRDIITKELEDEGRPCQDTRTREVRDLNYIGKPELKIISYKASGGLEYFLSFESLDKKLFSLLRLRFPKNSYLKSIRNYALIREVHTYGQELNIDEAGKVQHQGFGKKMIAKAEEIAKDAGYEYIVIISGVGVREYYRKLGYSLDETYMIKKL